MATAAPPSAAIPDFSLSAGHYDVLGVGIDATQDDLKRAMRERARRYHPDKNPDPRAEEWIKRINRAYAVLSDSIEREKYDDQANDEDEARAFDPATCLPEGDRFSIMFITQLHMWKLEAATVKPGLFPECFAKELDDFVQDPLKALVRVHPAKTVQTSLVLKVVKESPLDAMLDEMTDDHELSVTIISSQMYLADIQDRMRGLKYKCKPNTDSEIPIIDISNLTERDLFFLFSVFVQNIEEYEAQSASSSRKDLLEQISKYIPYCKLEEPPKVKPAKEQKNCTSCNKKFFVLSTHTCSACGNRFCRPCLQTKIALPRFGLNSPQPVCTACLATTQFRDMEDWMEAGKKLLKENTAESTKAAIGSFLMATSACNDEIPPTMQLGRFLIDNGYPEMAIPFMASLILHCNDPKHLLKVYLIVATAFRKLSERANTEPTEQWKLLLAAKEASLLARSEESAVANLTLEMPDQLSKRTEEINDALHAANAVKDKLFGQQINGFLSLLNLAWQGRDWENLLKIVLNESLHDEDFVMKENGLVEALEQFVSGKEKHIEQMLPEDRFPVMFLRGVVKLQHGSQSGISDIEAAAWSGFHSNWLCEAAVKIVLKLLGNGEASVLPLEEVAAACTALQRQILKGNIGNAKTHPFFFQPIEELSPPSSSQHQWPNLSVTGHNVKVFRKYEHAVSKNAESGDWSERDAALAYLDLFKTCEHPSEAAMCFITAGLWFLKELEKTSSKLDKYTIKKAIMVCLETAHHIATFSLHPGMQMYLSRLSIAVALCTIQLSGDLATDEDGKLLIQLLHTFVYASRFCPFWNAPIINISEVYLMNILSGRLHAEFTLGLSDIGEQHRPVHPSELKYQLYENDLRHFYSLDDPDQAHIEAMNEFLKTKGWSMDDVTNLLYSPHTPYDAEGWLIQQPVLGAPQEFSEVRGLVINTDSDHPSIELLVERSDRRKGRVGLFSMSDVHAALDLKKDELLPMFFSLDPPSGSRNQRFHPFQEFRYFSDNFANTDLLHTMFHTDYLLKSFSVGTEVSCKPPFKQRPCTEGLLAKLPYSLQQVLRPVAERGYSHNRVHRFWIQADEIVLDESEQTGSKKVIRIGNVKMVIRSHLLLPGPDGKMRDAPEDDDPDSPEAKFAADLTEHYDELCKHFPMFARLRELCKIQFVGIILNSVVESLERRAQGYDLVIPNDLVLKVQQDARAHHREKVGECLDDLSRQVGTWPSAESYSEVSAAVQTIQRNLPEYASYSQIEPHVKNALRQKDENTLSQVVDVLMSVCQSGVSRSTMTYHVCNWLQNRRQVNDLLVLICNSLPVPSQQDLRESVLQHQRQIRDSFKHEVRRLTANGKKAPISNPCKWVPAALLRKESSDGTSFSLCYGGVCLAPDVRHNPVPYKQGTAQVHIPQRSHQPISRPVVTRYRQPASTNGRQSTGSSMPQPRASAGSNCPPPRIPPTNTTTTASASDVKKGDNKGDKKGNKGGDKKRGNGGRKKGGDGGDKEGGDGKGKRGYKKTGFTLTAAVAMSTTTDRKKSTKSNPPSDKTNAADQPQTVRKNMSRKDKVRDKIINPQKGKNKTDGGKNFVIYVMKFNDGTFYVGRTTQALEARLCQHDRDIEKGTKTLGKHAAKVRADGGKLDYTVEIVDTATTKNELVTKEQKHIDRLDAVRSEEGLNIYNAIRKR